MPTDFKPTHTYHGTTKRYVGRDCMIVKEYDSKYVVIEFSDGFQLGPAMDKLKPIEQKLEFKPTHMYDNILHERNGQLCKLLPGTNYTGGEAYRNIVFEDGYETNNVNIKNLRELVEDSGLLYYVPDKVETDRNYKPDHYHSGGIDTWSFSEANMSTDKVIGFHLINVLKYVSRHEKKNGLEDLKKAQDSLREAIRLYEKEEADK